MMRRATGLLVGTVLVLTLGGCGSDGADSSKTPSTITGTTQEDADVREKLAAGLAAVSPAKAGLVEAAETTLTPVEAPWLPGWQVLDVESFAVSHPQRFYASLSDDGTALVLTGSPDSFAQMTRSAKVVVDDAAVATDVGDLYLDATRTFDAYSYRIESLSDIEWPELNADEEQQRAEFEAQYEALVQPAVAEQSADGWNVTAWMIDGRTLVRHSLVIAADGAVQDSVDVVATGLLLPESF